MTTKIDKAVIDGGLHEPGDVCWSFRTSKAKWLLAQGQDVSRTTYVDLWQALGSPNTGDGATTFTLPDGRGRVMVGAGAGSLKETVAAAAVTAASDQIAVGSNADKWITGMKVQLTTTGGLPGGLVAATDYYVIRVSSTAIKLASSLANAVAGTAIDITTAGTGNHTLTHALTARAVGDVGGEEAHATTVNEMPSHSHTINGATASTSGGAADIRSSGGPTGIAPTASNTGGSASHNNMPPYLGANLFIYAGV